MSRSTGSTTRRRREQVADAVRQAGRRAMLYQADVARLDATRAMVEAAERDSGRSTYWSTMPACFRASVFSTCEESDWDYVLDINLKGACFCAQAAARAMIASGPPGVDHQPDLGRRLSRVAARRALLREQGRRRVDDTADGAGAGAAPHPGQRDRAGSDRYGAAALWQQRGGADRDGAALPLGRARAPEEIARAAVFLASEEAGFITGQVMHVNGGGYLG